MHVENYGYDSYHLTISVWDTVLEDNWNVVEDQQVRRKKPTNCEQNLTWK